MNDQNFDWWHSRFSSDEYYPHEETCFHCGGSHASAKCQVGCPSLTSTSKRIEHTSNFTPLKIIRLSKPFNEILLNNLPFKDQGGFSIPFSIGNVNFDKAFFDLWININLMPVNIFRKLGFGELKPSTNIILQLADCHHKKTLGIIEGVVVKVQNLYFSVDFVVIDCEEDIDMPVILSKSFIHSGGGWFDLQEGTLIFKVEDKEVVFDLSSENDLPFEEQSCLETNEVEEEIEETSSPPPIEEYMSTILDAFEEHTFVGSNTMSEMVIPMVMLDPLQKPFEECLLQAILVKPENPEVVDYFDENKKGILVPFIVIETPSPLKFKELLPHLRYNKEYWEVTFDMKIAGAKRLYRACQMERFHLIAKEKKAHLLKESKLFAEQKLEYFKTSTTSPNLI